MLTDRQLLILKAIVDDFIYSAHPVGSRLLSKKEEVPYSPATIRNDMAELEEMGYLEKPHTSAGRIPSEKGYRYYVDHLLRPKTVSPEELRQIESIFDDHVAETEDIIRNSATILAELTTYTAIVLGPDVLQQKVKRFTLVPLEDHSAVVVIVTDSGRVESRTIELPPGVQSRDAEKMVRLLNERLVGSHLYELPRKLESETRSLIRSFTGNQSQLMETFRRAVMIEPKETMYYGGKLQLFNQPEFHDFEKVKALFALMDTASELSVLFPAHAEDGIHVRIGSENEHGAFGEMSVITTTYSAGATKAGGIAVIGPTRMDYRKVVTLLGILSSDLSRELANKMEP